MTNLGKTKTKEQGGPTQEQIADRARLLWVQHGSPGGRDLEYWLDAERQLRAEAQQRGSPGNSAAAKRRLDPVDAEKRLDGLIEQPPAPPQGTPAGENL